LQTFLHCHTQVCYPHSALHCPLCCDCRSESCCSLCAIHFSCDGRIALFARLKKFILS
jgi:hypothetical protein